MRPERRGFTLIELMIVITIIGIILAFILKAAMNSVRNAEKSATIALIAKLETALTDRVDALTQMRAEPNWMHQRLAAIWNGTNPPLMSNQRAQVIAQYDYIRAELPDVWIPDTGDANYPINFGGTAFSPSGLGLVGDWRDYVLPLGAGTTNPANINDTPAITGMKGASFAAAAGIYKQLGATPKGCDGADNGGVVGLIDDLAEGGLTVAQVTAKLANHKHKTARSEMLYAVLVEGTGPLGSIFDRDDFGPNEVKDTDNDGLLEFVDGFGEPLQFYRWPIMYRSDSQKGFPDLAKIGRDVALGVPIGPYETATVGGGNASYEQRELNPLDSNQQLVAPGWWGAFNNSYPWGNPRSTFSGLFHTLVDPLAVTAGAPSYTTYWDRSASATSPNPTFNGIYQRRAYNCRFLVLSGGPDKQPGTAQLGVDYRAIDDRGSFPLSNGSFVSGRDTTGAAVPVNVANVIRIENQGGKIDHGRDANGAPAMGAGGRNDTNTLLEEFGNDDISNHNLHASGGPLPAPG